jgi:hypothetical protein
MGIPGGCSPGSQDLDGVHQGKRSNKRKNHPFGMMGHQHLTCPEATNSIRHTTTTSGFAVNGTIQL